MLKKKIIQKAQTRALSAANPLHTTREAAFNIKWWKFPKHVWLHCSLPRWPSICELSNFWYQHGSYFFHYVNSLNHRPPHTTVSLGPLFFFLSQPWVIAFLVPLKSKCGIISFPCSSPMLMAQRVDGSESVQLQKPNQVNHISAFSGGSLTQVYSGVLRNLLSASEPLYISLDKQTEAEYEIRAEGEITTPPPQKKLRVLKCFS